MKNKTMKSRQSDIQLNNNGTLINKANFEGLRKINLSCNLGNQTGHINFSLTSHSEKRIEERSIKQEGIEIAIFYGKSFFKQGLIFYVIGTKLPDYISPQQRKFCRNLVVVVSGDSDQIITIYRNKDPFKYIRKKGKKLINNNNRLAA